MTQPTAAVIYLGRPTARGEGRRVESWQDIVESAGLQAIPIAVLDEHRRRWPPGPSAAVQLAEGTILPEAMLWSGKGLLAHLQQIDPALVICVTGRAWHPTLAGRPWQTVLDLCDHLSTSYRERSALTERRRTAVLYRGLAPLARRFERAKRPPCVKATAAGWHDAEVLGVEWVPNVTKLTFLDRTSPADHDLLFSGTLSYPPNIEALECVDRAWPIINQVRPGTTLLVGGARPGRIVHSMVETNGWTLQADFADLRSVASRASVAIAPLVTASGIQNKIVEAAALGLPIVASPAALAGLEPPFPAVAVAPEPEPLAEAIVGLLDDTSEQTRLAAEAASVVNARYRPTSYVDWLEELFR